MPSMVHIKGVVSLMMPLLLAFVAISILAIEETAQLMIPTGQIFRSLIEKSSTLLREILGSNRQRRLWQYGQQNDA